MPTYIMLSTLTPEGVQTVKNNPQRIKEVNKEIEQIGAKVVAQWAVLGQFDFVNVIEAPDEKTMAKVSLELGSRGTAQLPVARRDPDRRVHRVAVGRSETFDASPHSLREPASKTRDIAPRRQSDDRGRAAPATAIRAARRTSPAPTAGGRSAPTAWSTAPVGIKCPECARLPRSALVRLKPEPRGARGRGGVLRRRSRWASASCCCRAWGCSSR